MDPKRRKIIICRDFLINEASTHPKLFELLTTAFVYTIKQFDFFVEHLFIISDYELVLFEYKADENCDFITSVSSHINKTFTPDSVLLLIHIGTNMQFSSHDFTKYQYQLFKSGQPGIIYKILNERGQLFHELPIISNTQQTSAHCLNLLNSIWSYYSENYAKNFLSRI